MRILITGGGGTLGRALMTPLRDAGHTVRILTMTLGEMSEIWREISGVTKRVVRLPLPGRVPAAFRVGLNTAPDGDRGVVGWRDWLILKQRGE